MEIGRNSHSTTVVIKNITNISPTGKTHLEWEKIYLLKMCDFKSYEVK